jgi:hypothetical protein
MFVKITPRNTSRLAAETAKKAPSGRMIAAKQILPGRHRLEAYATLARCVVAVGSRSSRQLLLRHRSILRRVSVA